MMGRDRLRNRLPGKHSLGGRALKAGGWNVFQMAVQSTLRLASNLIMTRLLMPEAFGLIALISTLIIGFNLLTDIGVNRSIIRDPEGNTDRFLRTAWVVKIVRGAAISGGILAIALLIYLIAPFFATPGTIYADARLPGLLALSALVPTMIGFEATNKELAQRNLDFSRITMLMISAQVMSIMAMVGFAQISQTVWALMAGILVSNFVTTIGSHLFFAGPRMGYEWDPDIADRLWQYGKWLMGSSALTFVALHADKLIFGAYFTISTFGLYAIALIWVEAGQMVIKRLLDQVGFPILSDIIRNRPQDLVRLYRRFQKIADLLCIFGFIATYAAGPWLIHLLYTENYHTAGQFIGLLSLSFLSLRFNLMGGLLMNLGDSRAMLFISTFRAVGLVLGLIFGISAFGLPGGILAVAVAPLTSAPYTLAKVRPVLGQSVVIQGYLWVAGILALSAFSYMQVTF
jgi:O-antigen/teichoic acid export membrane protein